MGVLEDLADDLAVETIRGMEEFDISAVELDQLIKDLATNLGASSQTLEESYLTSIRVRMSARRGDQFLAEHFAALRKKKAQLAPKAAPVAKPAPRPQGS